MVWSNTRESMERDTACMQIMRVGVQHKKSKRTMTEDGDSKHASCTVIDEELLP